MRNNLRALKSKIEEVHIFSNLNNKPIDNKFLDFIKQHDNLLNNKIKSDNLHNQNNNLLYSSKNAKINMKDSENIMINVKDHENTNTNNSENIMINVKDHENTNNNTSENIMINVKDSKNDKNINIDTKNTENVNIKYENNNSIPKLNISEHNNEFLTNSDSFIKSADDYNSNLNKKNKIRVKKKHKKTNSKEEPTLYKKELPKDLENNSYDDEFSKYTGEVINYASKNYSNKSNQLINSNNNNNNHPAESTNYGKKIEEVRPEDEKYNFVKKLYEENKDIESPKTINNNDHLDYLEYFNPKLIKDLKNLKNLASEKLNDLLNELCISSNNLEESASTLRWIWKNHRNLNADKRPQAFDDILNNLVKWLDRDIETLKRLDNTVDINDHTTFNQHFMLDYNELRTLDTMSVNATTTSDEIRELLELIQELDILLSAFIG